MGEFKDKAAIVTGATRGIGRAIALALANEGCNIAFTYSRRDDLAEALLKELAELNVKGLGRKLPAHHLEDVKQMVDDVKKEFGGIDFLINNAGITRDKLLYSMSEEDWDAVIDTNLKGAFNFCRASIFTMMKSKRGSILNISSVSGVAGMPGQVNYASSKAGLIGMTKALAKEVARLNVNVNCLALGFIETDMTKGLPPEYKEKILEMIPARRMGTAVEVAKIAVFMLSDAAKYITGHVMHIDGGLAM